MRTTDDLYFDDVADSDLIGYFKPRDIANDMARGSGHQGHRRDIHQRRGPAAVARTCRPSVPAHSLCVSNPVRSVTKDITASDYQSDACVQKVMY